MPAELVELRRLVADSVGWRDEDGPSVSEGARAGLTSKQRAKLKWNPDKQLADQLAAAEEAFTATITSEVDKSCPGSLDPWPNVLAVTVTDLGGGDCRKLAEIARRHPPKERPAQLRVQAGGRLFNTGMVVDVADPGLEADVAGCGFGPPVVRVVRRDGR